MKPSLLLATLAAVAAAVTGCVATYTQQPGGGFGAPQVTLDTPGGFYPIYAPPAGPAVEPNLAAPPGLFAAPGGGNLPNPTGSPDGTYSGSANLLENDFGDCAFHFTLENLHVKNGYVRFAQFYGRVGPNGGVRMSDGSLNWITGHFSKGQFTGAYSNRYCAYSLALDRVAP